VIVVRLQGGLGNQMFQYAAAARLARHHNTTLHLDLGWFDRQPEAVTPRQYELGCFQIDARLDGIDLICAAGLGYDRRRLGALISRARGKLSRRFHVIREKTVAFQPDVLQAPDNSYLIGYWQTERYFSDIEDEIRSAFSLATTPDAKNAETAKQIARSEAVSIHVRRGDYTSAHVNQTHGLPSLEYYARASQYVARRTTQPRFFVFSDEPNWCRENLIIDHPTILVTNNTAETGHEDMRLMSMCKHHIIANSSFSWWGAWLNPDATKIVVAPNQWFRDPAGVCDVYANGWIRV
jgi:Glycosyl transferase family 11